MESFQPKAAPHADGWHLISASVRLALNPMQRTQNRAHCKAVWQPRALSLSLSLFYSSPYTDLLSLEHWIVLIMAEPSSTIVCVRARVWYKRLGVLHSQDSSFNSLIGLMSIWERGQQRLVCTWPDFLERWPCGSVSFLLHLVHK